MKVYIVTTGEYSDYHIDEVFTDLEQAQLYCAARNGVVCAEYYIEEWETDLHKMQGDKQVNRIWKGGFSKWWRKQGRNNMTPTTIQNWESFQPRNEVVITTSFVYVYVTTSLDVPEEKVKRIMIDRFNQWRYEQEA